MVRYQLYASLYPLSSKMNNNKGWEPAKKKRRGKRVQEKRGAKRGEKRGPWGRRVHGNEAHHNRASYQCHFKAWPCQLSHEEPPNHFRAACLKRDLATRSAVKQKKWSKDTRCHEIFPLYCTGMPWDFPYVQYLWLWLARRILRRWQAASIGLECERDLTSY